MAMTVDGQEVKNTYTYDDGHRLKTISHNGFEYTFQYDEFGNRTSVQAADKTLAAYRYLPHNGPLSRLTYGNGDYVDYTYDKEQRIKNLKANGAVICENIYDSDGRLVTQKDTAGDVDYHFNYDLIGRMTAMDTSKGQQLRIGYDDKNRVDSVVQKIDGGGYSVSYLYGDVDEQQKPGLIYGMNVEDTKRQEIEYDLLSRVNKKKILLDGEKAYVTSYTYKDGPGLGLTTELVESVTSGGATLSYTYDCCGNITTISEDGDLKARYHYDALNRLIREDNVWENKTICYVYDLGGNMLSRTEHAYTTGTPGTATKTDTYGYRSGGWKDQLISYNGSTIDYDDIGNPKTWRGMDLTWERGRMLKTLTKDGKTFTYTYDAGGNRVQKEVDGVTTRYFYNGDKVVGMTITNASGDVEKIHFIYDSEGNLFAMQTATGIYYYLHNLQNDIVGLIDSDGTQVVRYQYDSWGRPLDDGTTDTTGEQIGSRNPFRYREYFYDEESGLYYLGSRYYAPESGRFINEDTTDILEVQNDLYDKNLYVYCDTNPVIRIDKGGNMWGTAIAGGEALAASSGFSLSALGNSIMVGLGAITPAGWVAIAIVVVISVITVAVVSSKEKDDSKDDSKVRSTYPPALRKRYSTRKRALDAAKKAGKKRPPKKHNDETSGKHFHPNISNKYRITPKKPSLHDHYMYPKRF